MRSHGLHGSNYIVLHVRVSEEKTRERGKQMPNLDVYPKAAASALLKANVTRVFLQACARGVCAWRARGACMAFLHAWCVYGPRLAANNTIHMHIHMQTATPSAVTLLEGWSQRAHAHLSYTNSERTLHDLWMRRDTNASGCIGNTPTKLKHCRTQARAWHRAWRRAWHRAWHRARHRARHRA